MQGIDISNWKSDFNPDAVSFDFLIVQVTWGAGEVNANGIVNSVWQGADPKIQAVINSGRLFGYMHYIRGVGAEAEADFFANNTTGYLRKGIPMIDWEGGDNSAWGDYGYLERFVARYINATGVPPIIYAQASVYDQTKAVADKYNCGLHVAQYANNDATGYQDTPWNDDAYACAIRQYSSNGNLPGYGGALDLNKAYMDASAWMRYADPSGSAPVPTPSPSPQPDLNALADAVIRGDYGNGQERIDRLGDLYDAVMKIVNERLGGGGSGGSGGNQTYTVQPGDTLSGIGAKFGIDWQSLIGINNISDPNVIHPGEVLIIPGGGGGGGRTYTVQSGDTLSGIGASFGVNWPDIASANGIGDPYVIYPGQILRIP